MILLHHSLYSFFRFPDIYLQIANRDLLSSIGREFSGNVEHGLKTICKLFSTFFFFNFITNLIFKDPQKLIISF